MRDFKVFESVRCDFCGEEAMEFDNGIAGRCESCGYDWGDWDYYKDDEEEHEINELGLTSETFSEMVDELDLSLTQISKEAYLHSGDYWMGVERKLLTPELVLSDKIGRTKPLEIQSSFYACHTSAFDFLQRIDFFLFAKNQSKPEVKWSYLISISDVELVTKFYPAIFFGTIKQATKIFAEIEAAK
ncbi:hypothetical protein HRM2_19090 [Desulforapulum autotrophicum HRM2]|uniref:Uncharacterized protein n=1 Tax=Desulforapulum autotrophicum (strain ATCC 43914 / DSM 3382 / VKM B-1955 / HRM2) TaxID=177437 RepID=C0QBZ8_DESAH|nr:hypothetical protein [Desulforapulum autotrophicum]ACN15010.1 hypothetical protein HRM2_19090 [Desulforapulum autotrophicum HRM2]